MSAWRAFDERWQHLRDDASVRLRVSGFMNPDTLLDRVDQRLYLDASTVVSSGVFFTFLGFVIGLKGIAHTDVEQMKSGIGILLGGVQGAFQTSIIGIGGAAVWTYVNRRLMARLSSALSSLCTRLGNVIDPDEEEVFRQRVERMFSRGLGEMRTILADALEQALQPSLEQVQRQTVILEQQLQWEQRRSEEMADRMLDRMAEGTGDRIAQLAEVIDQTRRLQQQMLDAIEQLMVEQDQAVSRWEHMADRMEDVMGRLDALRAGMERLSTQQAGLGEQIGKYLQQSSWLVETQSRWIPALKETLDAHGQSMHQAGEHLRTAGTVVDERLQSLSEHWTSVQESFAQTRTALDGALQGFAERIDEGLGRTFKHFDATLADAVQNLAGLVSRTKELNGELADRVEEVGDALERVARTLRVPVAAHSEVPEA
ncbi:hypothetical protein [Alicyclobacillus sp.]|uniref:hypothetical protein n=1 Tax=Alicyclobacillus sp. TaxID=61169 RepID=UPI0025C349D2|nr:hypothetical protein [Alicyclobacillus sp.]MCL6517820.1 hypothetical protein [Alicyclobacillus sp.]